MAGQSPNIYAIDISERMLLRARERCKSLPGVYFIRGTRKPFRRISTKRRRDLLHGLDLPAARICRIAATGEPASCPRGVLSISYYAGLFDKAGKRRIRKAFPDQKYQYGAVPIGNSSPASKRCGMRTTRIDFRFEPDGIPVRLPVDPRAIRRIFPEDAVSRPDSESPRLVRTPLEEVDPVFMGWEFLIARKR